MKPPTPLPSIELLEANFTYDPVEGVLYNKNGKAVSNNDRAAGCGKIRIGRKTTTVARLCWSLFYRKDPGRKIIRHINGNPWDNRIENLRAVKR